MELKKIKQLAKEKQRGFTLIELLLYISLLIIFLSGAIRFSWDVIYIREKASIQRVVNQAATTTMLRITHEIRHSQSIQSISANQIVLNNEEVITTISLNGTTVEISPNGTGPYTLTGNPVKVTNLSFTETTNPNNNSKGVSIELSVEQSGSGMSQQFISDSTIRQSVELKKPFNQSHLLLVDLTSIEVSQNNQISGITFQNTGIEDLIIDQIYINWTGLTGLENLTNIQIGGGAKEWTGSASPESTVDITDYSISPEDDLIDLTYLQFDSEMTESSLFMNIILADGSVHKTAFTLPQ